jgi:hypothetical protein
VLALHLGNGNDKRGVLLGGRNIMHWWRWRTCLNILGNHNKQGHDQKECHIKQESVGKPRPVVTAARIWIKVWWKERCVIPIG